MYAARFPDGLDLLARWAPLAQGWRPHGPGSDLVQLSTGQHTAGQHAAGRPEDCVRAGSRAPAPAAPALTACGTGTQGEEVYAGADTSYPFALNVEQAWSQSEPGDSFVAYSPVTGQSYTITCTVPGAIHLHGRE